MRLESQKLLEDVRQAAEAIVQFTTGLTLPDYTSNAMLRSVIGYSARHLANQAFPVYPALETLDLPTAVIRGVR